MFQPISKLTLPRTTGSKFRILNELLYTSESSKALEYFQENKGHFDDVSHFLLFTCLLYSSIMKALQSRRKIGL